jgi:hypothetical protein
MVGGKNSNTGKKVLDDRCDRSEVAGQTGSVASSNSLLTAVNPSDLQRIKTTEMKERQPIK